MTAIHDISDDYTCTKVFRCLNICVGKSQNKLVVIADAESLS